MQAIQTKYIGPRNVKGSRVKAWCAAGSITLEWEDGWSPQDNHDHAAQQLAQKLGWLGTWHNATLPDDTEVYVLAERSTKAFRLKRNNLEVLVARNG